MQLHVECNTLGMSDLTFDIVPQPDETDFFLIPKAVFLVVCDPYINEL
jgi:hypothetical protein